MKKKNSKELKTIVICFFVFIAILIVALFVFLMNVSVNDGGTGLGEINIGDDLLQEEDSKMTSIDDIEESPYSIVAKDTEGTFQVILKNKKINFEVLSKDEFLKKYPKAKNDVEKSDEIIVHGYDITGVYVMNYKEKEYVLALTSDGSIGIMNVEDAVNEDVFRIKNKLISLDNKKVQEIYQSEKEVNNDSEKTIVVKCDDGKKYDLESFIKEND